MGKRLAENQITREDLDSDNEDNKVFQLYFI